MLTEEELKNIKIGQEVFVRTAYGHIYYPTVNKIGKKYFYTSDNRKWDKKDGVNISDYMSASIWPSEDGFQKHCSEMKIRNIFTSKIAKLSTRELSIEEIKNISVLLKIDLES